MRKLFCDDIVLSYTASALCVSKASYCRRISDRDRYKLRRAGSYFCFLSRLIACPSIIDVRICVLTNLN